MATITQSTLSPVQRILRLFGQYRREIRYIILYAVISGLINLSLPLGIQAIIGQIAGGGINASWGVLVLFVLVGAALTGVLRIMQLSVVEYIQRRIFTESALDFAVRIPRLNLESLRKEHLPELVNRFFDTITLQKGMPKVLIDGITAILQIIFSLLLLSVYHASFLMFSLLLLGVLAVLFYWIAPRGLQTSLQESKYKYKLVFWLEEMARVAVTFKLAGENDFPIRRTDEITAHYLDARSRHWRILMVKFISSTVFRVLTLGSFLVLGSLLVMQNELNIGQFVAAEILILFVIESVEKLIVLHETGYDVLTATEKLGQVADLPLEREGGVRVEEFCANRQPLAVELRNLSYQFADGDSKILKDIQLKISPGERVAVSGYNASGKSTLMQILSVVRRDFTGTLLFNGLPKQNLNLRSLREHIGDLSSQEDIFKGTILENITIGNRKIGLPRVLEVVESLGLNEFVRDSPNGLDTELLPGGINIPRSTITKILVARSVVAMPNLLVMEEPLTALNFKDRINVAQYLAKKDQPWTLICVTEDPVMAAVCDRVLILKEGEIIFDGSFEAAQQTKDFTKVFRSNLI
ncbi:MAG TPA: ATP-binding cassette domain-containing protein [Saprospiraceae bacterium]|nr:ATP-binding cassette domain-containing protein [Saprospiraceae bacterium]